MAFRRVGKAKTQRSAPRSARFWGERRPHLGGPVGRAIYRQCLARGWVAHQLDSRAVRVTPEGYKGLARVLGLALPAPPLVNKRNTRRRA